MLFNLDEMFTPLNDFKYSIGEVADSNLLGSFFSISLGPTALLSQFHPSGFRFVETAAWILSNVDT